MTTSNKTTSSAGTDLHRLLDRAFAGIDMTEERQDLKEEIRANLLARAAELEASGVASGEAARRAVDELGDVRTLLGLDEPVPDAGVPSWVQHQAQHRVRPDPAFVVRTVVLSVVGTAALAVFALAATTATVALGVQVAAAVVAALAAGVVTADALGQETTGNHPMPAGRATGYGVGAALVLAGIGAGALYPRDSDVPWLVAGALLVLAGVIPLARLGATQTNRHKAWRVRAQASQAEITDRFSADPAAAARFGLYTGAIWTAAAAGFVVLGITAGWMWSWPALVAGLVTIMLVLARMLFGQHA